MPITLEECILKGPKDLFVCKEILRIKGRDYVKLICNKKGHKTIKRVYSFNEFFLLNATSHLKKTKMRI
jgi:hypothetical protein